MKHELQVRILKELMAQVDAGKNVDCGRQYEASTSAYTDPTLAEDEWQTFFRNHPQLIGLSGDLPEPGSYFTVDDFGTPVLATRDNEGVFRAFVNACRHRGVRVANDQRGTAGRFSCPFHAWTYSNQGDLVAIPQEDQFGLVDKSCNGLLVLPAVEHNGMLWVHPQPDGAIDIDALLGPLAEEMAGFDFGSLEYCGESVIDKNLNWKLANDTFGETYHFQKLHRNTLGQIFYGDNLAYETIGRNHRFVFASKAIDLLREQPEEDWVLTDGANLLYYLFPNIQFNVGTDTVALIKIYPDAANPGRSITKVSHYFSKEMIAMANSDQSDVKKVTGENVYDGEVAAETVFSLDAIMEVFDSTIEQEDYAMGETTQRAAESGVLKTLMFGRNEPALHHYHNTFAEALNRPPLKRTA